MREMKDSGMDWIGKIPNDWKAVRLKYVINNLDWQRVPVDANKRSQAGDELYDYYGASGIIDKINGYTTEGRNILIGEDGANLVLRNLPIIYIAEGKYWVNNHAHILHPKEGNDLDFFAYQMEIIDYSLYITGSAQPKLSQSNLNNVILAVPPQKEQEYIATYLQKRILEINSTMSNIQHQIELLQEYKQSVITEAVTKGLDKNVAMKDSNEFIGKIPQSWSICKVKHVSDFVTDGAHISPDTSEEEYLFLSVTDMDDYGNLNFDNCLRITTAQYNYLVRTGCKPQKNDVIISKDGTIGKTTIIETDKDFVVASSLVIIHPSKNKIIAKYLRYSLMSKFVQEQLQMLLAGSALKRVSVGKNANLKIVYTSNINEQEDIIDYLDKKCAEIDAILADKQKQLDTLTEYKKSLIYEYVTGKKEVPADA